ncbi:hypothetical protein C2S51_002493 [Perilla frutescens var. frutescens]|nr:hypothetical protein C2S51_002493 [Perilla frutescens var. frutescens]
MLRLRRFISAAPRNVNGGNLLKKEDKIFPIVPMHNPSQRISARFLDIYEDSKDEMSRSYFQDMKDMEKHGGKVSKANKILIPASSAIKFPTLEVNFPDGSCLKLLLTSKENDVNASTSDTAKGYSLKLPLTSKANDTNASTSDTAKASLLCLSFRDCSTPMVDSWISPFLKTFTHSSDVRVYEVSFIDSWLLSRWLTRKLFLKFMKKPAPGEKQDALHRQLVYAFVMEIPALLYFSFWSLISITSLEFGFIALDTENSQISPVFIFLLKRFLAFSVCHSSTYALVHRYEATNTSLLNHLKLSIFGFSFLFYLYFSWGPIPVRLVLCYAFAVTAIISLLTRRVDIALSVDFIVRSITFSLKVQNDTFFPLFVLVAAFFTAGIATISSNRETIRAETQSKMVEFAVWGVASFAFQMLVRLESLSHVLAFLCFAVAWLGCIALTMARFDFRSFDFLACNVVMGCTSRFGLSGPTWVANGVSVVLFVLHSKLMTVCFVHDRDVVLW